MEVPKVLRVATKCFPTDTYYKSFLDSNTTVWSGQAMWMLKTMENVLPKIKIVTDLSPSNVTLDTVQTLADDRADLANDNFGLTFSRFLLSE